MAKMRSTAAPLHRYPLPPLGMAVEKLTVFTQENTKTIFRGPIKQHMLTFIDLKADYADEFKETLSKVLLLILKKIVIL